MNAALAVRVFARACEIRAELSFRRGHDQAKWNLFRQVEELPRAISPAMPLDGISEKLDKEPDGTPFRNFESSTTRTLAGRRQRGDGRRRVDMVASLNGSIENVKTAERSCGQSTGRDER
jgi:hypothetical protein